MTSIVEVVAWLLTAAVVGWFLWRLASCFLVVVETDEALPLRLLGQPRRVLKPGLRFVWWPLERLGARVKQHGSIERRIAGTTGDFVPVTVALRLHYQLEDALKTAGNDLSLILAEEIDMVLPAVLAQYTGGGKGEKPLDVIELGRHLSERIRSEADWPGRLGVSLTRCVVSALDVDAARSFAPDTASSGRTHQRRWTEAVGDEDDRLAAMKEASTIASECECRALLAFARACRDSGLTTDECLRYVRQWRACDVAGELVERSESCEKFQ